jgi:hypothetical protein
MSVILQCWGCRDAKCPSMVLNVLCALLARCPEIPRMLIGMEVLVTQKPASPHSAKRAKPRHQDRAKPLRWEDRSQQESLKAMCPSRQPSGSSPVIQRCSSSHARLAQTPDTSSACMQCFLSSEKPFTEAISNCAFIVMCFSGVHLSSYPTEANVRPRRFCC